MMKMILTPTLTLLHFSNGDTKPESNVWKKWMPRKKLLPKKRKKKEQEIEALKKKMATAALSESEMAIIKKGLNELEKEAKQAKQKVEEVIDEERKMPLNVDTISQEGFSKSIINKPKPRTNENLSEKEREKKMRDFVSKYEKEIK